MKIYKQITTYLNKESPDKNTRDQIFGAFFLMAIAGFVFSFYDGGSAKKYAMEGEITKITWSCTNRDIPTLTFRDTKGEIKSVCYDSIVLTRKDIKIGDYIVKKKGSYTAMVNGKEVQFAYNRYK